jgi:hypothetical protein
LLVLPPLGPSHLSTLRLLHLEQTSRAEKAEAVRLLAAVAVAVDITQVLNVAEERYRPLPTGLG